MTCVLRFEIRNRVVHPKCAMDLEVTATEALLVAEIGDEFFCRHVNQFVQWLRSKGAEARVGACGGTPKAVSEQSVAMKNVRAGAAGNIRIAALRPRLWRSYALTLQLNFPDTRSLALLNADKKHAGAV